MSVIACAGSSADGMAFSGTDSALPSDAFHVGT
jgi:hypothetical protein